MDIGLHLFDVARFLMGDVARLACMTQRLNPIVRGEDAFTALLRHDERRGDERRVQLLSRTIEPDPFPRDLRPGRGRRTGTLELDARLAAARAPRRARSREIDGDPPVPAWGERPWHAGAGLGRGLRGARRRRAARARPSRSPRAGTTSSTLAMTLAAYRSAARGETVDIAAFVAGGCAAVSRIEADYWIETAWPLAEAAEAMAGEQSSGTFLPVPGETPELKARAAARVEALEDLGPVAGPSLPGAGRADRPHRQGAGHAVLADRQHGAVAAEPDRDGGRQSLRAASSSPGCACSTCGCRRRSPRRTPGRQFGIEGTRRLAGVEGRPLIGTIVKPSVGLDADGDGGAGRRALRAPASTSSRTTSCRATGRPARSRTGRGR